MAKIWDSKITIPGTDVKVPSWALLAGGAGIIAAVVLAPKGQASEQGDFDEEGYYDDEGEGGILGIFDELAEMFAGLEQPGLLYEPVASSPVPVAQTVYQYGDDEGASYASATLPPAFDYLSRARELEALAGQTQDPTVRGHVASAARYTGLASLSEEYYAGVAKQTQEQVARQSGRTLGTITDLARRSNVLQKAASTASSPQLKQQYTESARLTGLASYYQTRTPTPTQSPTISSGAGVQEN